MSQQNDVLSNVTNLSEIQEFDNGETGFLAKKQFLWHWLLS